MSGVPGLTPEERLKALLVYADRMGIELDSFGALGDWLARLSERPAIAAELDVVAAL